MAQIHYDEDTPHLQAYFLPIVNEVKRKCYKRDSAGNLIKENGKTILLRDKDNKIIYESIKGNFLNNDQFWKDLGGRKKRRLSSSGAFICLSFALHSLYRRNQG